MELCPFALNQMGPHTSSRAGWIIQDTTVHRTRLKEEGNVSKFGAVRWLSLPGLCYIRQKPGEVTTIDKAKPVSISYSSRTGLDMSMWDKAKPARFQSCGKTPIPRSLH